MKRLVILGGGAMLIDTPDRAKRLARAIVSDIALYNREEIRKGIKNDNLFEVLGEERRRALEAGNRARMERNGSETLAHDLAACNAWQDGLAAATRRDCPTLLLCGALDRMTPVKAIGPLHEALHAGGGEVRRVELAGCGHAMQEEDPVAVVRALLWSD